MAVAILYTDLATTEISHDLLCNLLGLLLCVEHATCAVGMPFFDGPLTTVLDDVSVIFAHRGAQIEDYTM